MKSDIFNLDIVYSGSWPTVSKSKQDKVFAPYNGTPQDLRYAYQDLFPEFYRREKDNEKAAPRDDDGPDYSDGEMQIDEEDSTDEVEAKPVRKPATRQFKITH